MKSNAKKSNWQNRTHIYLKSRWVYGSIRYAWKQKKEIKEHRMRSSKMNVIEITKDNSESWEAMFKEMIVKAFENWSRIFSDWN